MKIVIIIALVILVLTGNLVQEEKEVEQYVDREYTAQRVEEGAKNLRDTFSGQRPLIRDEQPITVPLESVQ